MIGYIALEDGSIFYGETFGANKTVVGEICFNTSMTGYQEILTDPSYKGQVVTMTYPEIGNYGVNPEDEESWEPHVSGLVVRELSPIASNWRCKETLPDYMMRHGIPGLMHIDTRALTKKLRTSGAMKGVLSNQSLPTEKAVEMARSWQGMDGSDFVKDVTCREPFLWDDDKHRSHDFVDAYELSQNLNARTLPPIKHSIIAYDFGIKYNILRRLRQHGFSVRVVPATTQASEIIAARPDGVFLSNGPGDPAALGYVHSNIKQLIGHCPIFGICLGHQLIAHALGGKTFKLKFGHRGGNQPVKDLMRGSVKITAQNHGFAVDPRSLPEDVELTHINLNDGTCEGLRHKKHPVFSVQYHPEAAPGPNDATYFFDLFSKEIDKFKKIA